MSGEHGDGRLRIEDWEKELAKRIAGRFRVGDQELAAELLMRLVELKANTPSGIHNWQAFLAQSLYNAAKNFIRHEDVLHRRFTSFESADRVEKDRPPSVAERLAAPEEPIESRLDVGRVWKALTPEMQELWQLLSENHGNTSLVAKKLRRPRKTVEYWIKKLKAFVLSRGIR